ncbi:DoxX family protein [Aeromicrobium sp. Leaf350]|uniref:DoxX family protein n=1 Tax=Aeromicrobium sp. Leaf350 TaxID=2876565 RepID=UPI001E3E7178|nr:DoxX family protein [Aeromicrobium sp. Leaf350]
MTVLRTVARPMLASMFVVGGINSLRHAKALAPAAQPVSDAIAPLAPQLPVTPTNVVRAHGAINVVAGAALATGRLPRLSALVLAGNLAPATVQGHRFWAEPDAAARSNQQVHFFKNVSLLGGLLMSTLDPDPHKKILVRRAKDKVVEAADTVADAISR